MSMMDKKETVLITGGTSLVGRAVIPALIEAGHDVVFTSRQDVTIDGALCVKGDLLEEGGVDALLSALGARDIQITHLINNFRDSDNLKTAEGGVPNEAQWLREYRAAVVVPYQLSIGLAKAGALRSVVNISSIYGITAGNLTLYDGDQRAAPIHYNVAKAAENHLTKELAVRMAPEKYPREWRCVWRD